MISFLREHLAGSPDWEHKGSKDVRPGSMMNAPEQLIAEYKLTDWMNTNYSGSDPLKRSTITVLKVNYRRLRRRRSATSGRVLDSNENVSS
jgi:putative DNA primase/helicase